MSDFEKFERPPDYESQTRGPSREQLFKGASAVAFGLGIVGVLVYGIEKRSAERAQAAVHTVMSIHDQPESALPANWVREQREGQTVYYSAPLEDVCEELTEPEIEMPPEIVSVTLHSKVQSCRIGAGTARVYVFEVAK
jgi:hypothetical protein